MTWILFVFTGAAWGGSFLFMRMASPEFGAVPLAALRLGLGGLILLPAAWPHRRELLRQWKAVAALGILNGALPFSLFAWALKQLYAGHGAILNATTPLFVALFGQLFYGQPQSRRVWLGLLLGILGVAVCMEPWKAGVLPQLLPTLAVLLATACYGWAGHIMAKLDHLPPLCVAWVNTGGGFLFLFLPALFFLPGENPSGTAWGAALTLGIVSTGLAWGAFTYMYKAWGILRASLVTYLIPFFGMLWGWKVLGELPKPGWWPGLLLVLGGLVLVKRKALER